jgi:hypothetical protein
LSALLYSNSAYGLEEEPIITINFISGDVIDLDKNPQMIRADIEIQNYDPQHGYHFMQVIRLSDQEIIKDTEILPKIIDDNLFGVQILHYLEPNDDESNLLGDYGLRIYSEFGSSEAVSTFSIIKSSIPPTISQNIPEDVESIEEDPNPIEEVESLEINNSEQTESKIPSWVHDVFVWYADETITENELLTAIEYLISQGILNITYD